MAIKACKECSHELSTKAAVCPHCGAPTELIQSSTGCSGAVALLLAIFLTVAFIGWLSGG